MEAVFMECDACRAKPGMPVLCDGCLHNRALISKLNLKELARECRIEPRGEQSRKDALRTIPPDVLVAMDVLKFSCGVSSELLQAANRTVETYLTTSLVVKMTPEQAYENGYKAAANKYAPPPP